MKPTRPLRNKFSVFATTPCVGLVLGCTLAFGQPDKNKPDPVPASLAQGRDLHAYEDGGMYRAIGYVIDVDRLRDFVWTRWTRKQRAYVEIVYQSTDTANKVWLFVEPNDGRWSIRWDEIFCSVNGCDGPNTSNAIVTVERLRGYLIFFDADDHIVKYL
jgi:hypothetical protein